MDFDFIAHEANITTTQAHFCGWDGLDNLCSALLTGFFKRPVMVKAFGDDDSDVWTLELQDAPLSKEKQAALMDALHTDDLVRDLNDCGSDPVWEISHALSEKLVALTLPFEVQGSHAADDGVWFTGEIPSATVRLLIQYPEADYSPVLLTVPLAEGVTKEDVITAFHKAMRVEDREVRESLPDHQARLILVTADMEATLKVRITPTPVDAVSAVQ